MPAAEVVECADFKESLFASELTSECVAIFRVPGDDPAENCVVLCMAGVDLLVTSVMAAGACVLSKIVVTVPWKRVAAAVA